MALLKIATLVIITAIAYTYFKDKQRMRIVLDSLPDEEYDYVVIGGGSAGSVVAARLSEDRDYKVLLLEAGGHYDESELFHIPAMWAALQNTQYDWGFYTEPQSQAFRGMRDNKGVWPRGRVLGGSSILNAMHYTRGSHFDFDEWAMAGCEGWSYKNVLPYFLKSEDIQIKELESSPYHSKGGPIAVTHGYTSALADVFMNSGAELGYNVTDYNGEDQEGFSIIQKSIRNGVRSSTSLEYLAETGKLDNLHISVHSLVTKIDIANKRAVGVFFIKDGRKRYVNVRKEVVLSAGAVNSPQLLMLSGIGPRNHLTELNIPIVAELPVGENLQDHQMVVMPSKINKPCSVTANKLRSWWTLLRYYISGDGELSDNGSEVSAFLHLDKNQRGKTYPDIQYIFFKSLLPINIFNYNDQLADQLLFPGGNVHGFTTLIALTRPKSTGRITLRSTDPFDHPKIDPGYITENTDVKTLIGGIRIWEELTQTKAFKNIGVDIDQLRMSFCSEFKFRSDEYWECFIRHTVLTVYHHSGTCKMGAMDNPTAVVDYELKVKGIQGLRVVDASIFPNVTSGNINASVIMVAEKSADLILGKNTVKKFRTNIPD